MSAAAKTLELLDFFSNERPEIGLSQLCRLAGRDKATTYRHLQALEDKGFIEQNPITKHYRLGPRILQLAQTREKTVPRRAGVEEPLKNLTDAIGETTHVSVLSGTTLYKLLSIESPRHSIRVVIDIDEFPLHATASGLCALAFGPETLFETALRQMQAFTPQTIATDTALQTALATTRRDGISRADGSFESDVHSLAAPLFDHTGAFAGAVSVASLSARFTAALERSIRLDLMQTSREITHNWGGSVPPHVEQAWNASVAKPKEMDIAR